MDPAAKRGIRRGLILGVPLALAAGLFAWSRADIATEADTVAAADFGAGVGGPFALTAPDGSTVTERDLAGRPFLIFFGFTRCPDVCPTTLARMASLRQRLGPAGEDVAIVFVSVDPEEDSPETIGRYLTLFGDDIIGLTGDDARLAEVKRAYGVHAERVPLEGGGYTVDHTATIFLMGRDGRFVSTIDAHEPDAPALAKLERALAT